MNIKWVREGRKNNHGSECLFVLLHLLWFKDQIQRTYSLQENEAKWTQSWNLHLLLLKPELKAPSRFQLVLINIIVNSVFTIFLDSFIFITSQPGPDATRESLHHPSGYFTLHNVFSPETHLGFGVWGTPGSRGQVGWVMLVLRTFPELVGGLCKIWWRLVRRFGHEKGTKVQTVTFIYIEVIYVFPLKYSFAQRIFINTPFGLNHS